MRPLMRDVDVVIANEEDLQSVLGMTVKDTDVTSGTLDVDALPRSGRARDARLWSAAGRHHAAREPLGERQRLERRPVGRPRRRCIRASATRCASSIASAAATASPAA